MLILVAAVLFDLDGTLVESVSAGDALPTPGALIALDGLPTARWAVVSRTSRRGIVDVLRSAGLPQPRVAVGGDDVQRQKPSPEGYLRAATLLGVQPQRCLVVEDSAAGVAAGHAAGALVLGLGTAVLVDGAQWQAEDLSEVVFEADRAGIRVELPD